MGKLRGKVVVRLPELDSPFANVVRRPQVLGVAASHIDKKRHVTSDFTPSRIYLTSEGTVRKKYKLAWGRGDKS